jgi:cell pole-organizing protein PopZ
VRGAEIKRTLSGVGLESEMSQPAKAQEPSMEEILASIRRIIADDETAKPADSKAADPEPKPVEVKPAPVKVETRAAPPPVQAVRPVPEPVRTAPMPQPVPVSQPAAEMEAMLADVDDGPMPVPSPDNDVLELTEEMARPAPAPAFRTVEIRDDLEFTESQDEEVTPEPPPAAMTQARPLMSANTMAAVDSAFNSLANTVLAGNARTLEDLVREMLRPMLKSWLDDNLPVMVERIVRAEIERVSRGR